MIQIKQYKNKPKLTKIQFNCDEIISEKLKDYGGLCDFINKYNTTLIIGKQGQGKTSLTINIIKKFYRKKFEHVYVFMPHSSRKSIKNNPFDCLDESQLFEELTQENIDALYQVIKMNSELDEKSLIIFDDVQKALKDVNVLRSLKNIIANQRHLKVVNLILCQNFFSLDKSLREICNNLFMFNTGKSQLNKIFLECIESDKDKFDDIRKLIFKNNHNWLFINLNSQRIFNDNFDEILYLEDDENDEY